MTLNVVFDLGGVVFNWRPDDLVRVVKDFGNKLFVLSNMHFASIAYLEQAHQIWELFDGVVVSCRIQKVKPGKAIYEHLLATHDLKPSSTVFIDDLSENLAAAATLGIQTIQFASPAQCRQELQNLNCL